MVTDYFKPKGNHYLVTADRLSGWLNVIHADRHNRGARGLIKALRSLFASNSVLEELTSAGGPEFSSGETRQFLHDWDVSHRLTSAYHPQSNGHAEAAVKSAKKNLCDHVSSTGSLDNDVVLQANLAHRNTPDQESGKAPANVVCNRKLTYAFVFRRWKDMFTDRDVQPEWREAWFHKEMAFRTRFSRNLERRKEHARPLKPLNVGQRVLIQSQGADPRRWDRSGVVVEVGNHDL